MRVFKAFGASTAVATLAILASGSPSLAQEAAPAPTPNAASAPDPITYGSAFPVTAGEEAAITQIIKDIGDKRVVALGEISHGDGSSFAFKARLIERLWRDHGFDVLAMEGGFYDHLEAEERIAAGAKASDAFALANYTMWTTSDQFKPLLKTIDEAAASERPFSLIGFDFQHSGHMREANYKRLMDIADRLGEDGSHVHTLIEIWYSLHRAKEGPFRAFTAVLDTIDESRLAALNAIKEAGGETAKRDYRVIDNHAKFLRHSSLASRMGIEAMGWQEFNTRDAMMATNLYVDALQNYRERKIIVWAATAHVMKDRSKVDSEMSMVPMGYFLDQGSLSDDYYVLAFSTLGGRNGTLSGQVFDIDPADPDGIETHAMDKAKGADTAFVDLPQCGQATAKIRALGYRYYTGDWGCAIDGLVVFREMEPTRYSSRHAALSD